jgi:hypoxanthine phosphoribosyltransferase
MLEETGAAVRLCVLLDKPSRREVTIEPEFVGFKVPNRFVVGYGIDYAEEFRGLPFIAFVNDT